MFRILFLGTPDFAVPSLRALAQDERFEIVGVVTQPDRPVGRKGTITPPPVKVEAQKLGIVTIQQPETLTESDFKTWIEKIGPTCDAFVVVAYGKIFRPWFLELPKHGLVNVHASLLPRWRGASPINAAIAAGDLESGVSIMRIEPEMDRGPILATQETPLSESETAESLHDKLSRMGADLLPKTLAGYLEGSITAHPQDDSKATYCSMLTRDNGRLDVTKSATELEQLLRAYTPWPGLWTEIDGKRIKILNAIPHTQNVIEENTTASHDQPERRIIYNGYPAFICGSGSILVLTRVQLEGKPAMDGKDFLHGFRWSSFA